MSVGSVPKDESSPEDPARARREPLPHAYHWGQALPLTGEWVKERLGPSETRGSPRGGAS